MKVVIMGCGRVGAKLATEFDRTGHSVSIIDRRPEAFRRLASEYGGRTILGTGIDEDILRAAGIEEADCFIAVTNGDNTNIMTAQIAKHMFDVRSVICRIYDPIREEFYREQGLDTICPTTIISEQIKERLIDGDRAQEQ